MKISKTFCLFSLLILWISALPAAACGRQTDCIVSNGDYRIFAPDSWDSEPDTTTPRGAILFFHGWKGSSASTMNNRRLREAASELGVALVAVNGLEGSWSFPQSPGRRRNELAYTQAVLDDIGERFSVDQTRVLAAGFSIGGSMVWYLSCYMGDQFAGFSPFAGTFWVPLPETCPSAPPNLFHYHGRKDGTFPLSGRPIAGGLYHQGDTYKGFDLWKSLGSCQTEEPATTRSGVLSCERRSQCAGGVLEICLHDGGHTYQAAWLMRSWAALSEIKGW